MPEQALSHLKVLELCNLVSGPYCTKLLADLGAEVIKIEPPGVGDDARRRGPFPEDIAHQERSGLYLFLNTSKMGITLDVKTKAGKNIFTELVKQADILVEDNLPTAMLELGLTFKDLKEINPRLIMTSITPFGQTGPYKDYKAYELNSYHAGGEGYLLPSQSPDLTREPVKAGGLAGDCVCGLHASLATLAAAYWMNITDVGQHIDISKQEVLMNLVRVELPMYANEGEVRRRIRWNALVPSLMECQDGHIVIVPQERPWQDVVRAVGNPPGDNDGRFTQWLDLDLPDDKIGPYVQEWVRQFEKEDLFHRLQANSVACSPINTTEDMVHSPQIIDRGFFAEIDHPEAGKLKYPTAAYQFSQTPWRAGRPAPLLGQHNESVYCERLGFTTQDLVKMQESKVI